jgi:isopenicillin N synthase-like dioxygenase
VNTVPALSLKMDPAAFSQAFGDSFRTFGFGVVTDHGVDAETLKRAWEITREFFALPVDVKNRYYVDGLAGARGYTPFGIEIAKDAKKVDLKEFWHVGRDLPDGHRFRGHMADNVWPTEIPDFKPVFKRLFAEYDAAGDKMLAAIAKYLGLAPDYFDAVVENGNSVMRLLHYPPITPDAEGIRAEAHGDINLITLLLGAEEGGLQLLSKSGDWIEVPVPEGALVINVGDMLERLTNNYLPSTIHRVINPPPERRHIPRYSMPFFLHPASDFLIKTLPQCVDADHPDLYPAPITADGFLQQRLQEIGLKK